MPSPPHPRSRTSVCSKALHVLAASSRVDTANTDIVISATVSVPGQSPPNWVDARAKSLHMLRLHQLGRHSALAVVEVPVEGEVGRAGRHGDTVVLGHNRRVVRSRPHAQLVHVTVERDPRRRQTLRLWRHLSEDESTTGGERVGRQTHDVYECVGVRHDDIHVQDGHLVVPVQVELSSPLSRFTTENVAVVGQHDGRQGR